MRATWMFSKLELTAQELKDEGIMYQKFPANNYQPGLDIIKSYWGYQYQDVIELLPETPNLQAICDKFDKEHLHTDDEVRFVIFGEGVFDIRSGKDLWMHIKVEAGDFIRIPANRYHLFYLTETKHIRCVRLFKDNPSWVPRYRELAAIYS
ncbi:MAG: hypothetical protein A2901_06795 [Elusimicrobia bacterium RIFCSPLOWO2_01_FULL_54_10]|nr:MAG: hypothetical protein A2901_06795 [Elusimicrobia bacterium RIFCSPLOWO2_01_FULL_54_10]